VGLLVSLSCGSESAIAAFSFAFASISVDWFYDWNVTRDAESLCLSDFTTLLVAADLETTSVCCSGFIYEDVWDVLLSNWPESGYETSLGLDWADIASCRNYNTAVLEMWAGTLLFAWAVQIYIFMLVSVDWCGTDWISKIIDLCEYFGCFVFDWGWNVVDSAQTERLSWLYCDNSGDYESGKKWSHVSGISRIQVIASRMIPTFKDSCVARNGTLEAQPRLPFCLHFYTCLLAALLYLIYLHNKN
jgi:hypothetical protein